MKNCLLCSLCLGVLLASVSPIRAQVAPTNAEGTNLVSNGNFAATATAPWIFSAKMPAVSVVEVQGQKFGRALRLELASQVAQPWDARMATPKIGLALEKDSLLAVRFWARSPQNNQIGVRFQQSQAPYNKFLSRNITLSPDWAEYRFFTKLGNAFAPEATQFEFHLGYGIGIIELADIRVENFGDGDVKDLEVKFGPQSVDYWGGRPRDDKWKVAALERIEKYRKSDLSLRVVTGEGKAVPGANITLVQTRSLFRWGSAVNAARLIDTGNADNLRYQAEVKRLYNTVVFENDLKWRGESEKRTEQALLAAQWLKANNIEIRGHNLVWGSRKFLPQNIADNWDDTEKLRQLVRDRVREAALKWKGQLYVWDAVNEAATNTELWDKLGWDEFANVFKIAREVDPDVMLAYNDYNIANEAQNPAGNAKQRARAVEIVQLLRDKGAPVDIFGDQAHFGTPLTHPSRIVEIWAEMAKLGMPLEITEYDAAIPDDQLHAQYTRDVMMAAFAEPDVESFILWGFWAGAHWRANDGGAMFHLDWSKRPAQEAYEDLVLKQWRTNAQLTTDDKGMVQTRGFQGEYDVVVQAKGREKTVHLSLGKDGFIQQIVL